MVCRFGWGWGRGLWKPCSPARCSQSGLELSSRLDALSAEKDTLSSVVRQRQAELVAAQSLVREKEEALSWEQQRSSRERDELQGRLADKVRAPLPLPLSSPLPLPLSSPRNS